MFSFSRTQGEHVHGGHERFMKLHTTDSAAGCVLVKQYDNELLVPMLVPIRR